MTFMKFIFLAFKMKDVDIGVQEAIDLLIYVGRNIEDNSFGYDRLEDIRKKQEKPKQGSKYYMREDDIFMEKDVHNLEKRKTNEEDQPED